MLFLEEKNTMARNPTRRVVRDDSAGPRTMYKPQDEVIVLNSGRVRIEP